MSQHPNTTDLCGAPLLDCPIQEGPVSSAARSVSIACSLQTAGADSKEQWQGTGRWRGEVASHSRNPPSGLFPGLIELDPTATNLLAHTHTLAWDLHFCSVLRCCSTP